MSKSLPKFESFVGRKVNESTLLPYQKSINRDHSRIDSPFTGKLPELNTSTHPRVGDTIAIWYDNTGQYLGWSSKYLASKFMKEIGGWRRRGAPGWGYSETDEYGAKESLTVYEKTVTEEMVADLGDSIRLLKAKVDDSIKQFERNGFGNDVAYLVKYGGNLKDDPELLKLVDEYSKEATNLNIRYLKSLTSILDRKMSNS